MDILDKARGIVKLAHEVGNMDLYAKMVQLQSDLAATVGENFQLREKVRELEAAARQRAVMHYDGTLYWTSKEKKNPEDGPYCPGCWDMSSKLSRLRGTGPGFWYCMGCKQGIDEPNAGPAVQVAPRESAIDEL